MLFVFLCTLQIMLIAHTRILVDYAAFNAARAGVVHNGNQAVMRNAALLSLVPAFPLYLEKGEKAPKSAIDRFLIAWVKLKVLAEIGSVIDSGTASFEKFLSKASGGKVNFAGLFPNASIVSVDVLSPSEAHFDESGPGADEIDFDLGGRLEGPPEDEAHLTRTDLTIRVVFLYQLRVPIADRTIWYLYMAGAYLTGNLKRADYRDYWHLEDEAGEEVKDKLERSSMATNLDLTQFPNGLAAVFREQLMFLALKAVHNAQNDLLFMPIYSIHTMPMESNFYRKNL